MNRPAPTVGNSDNTSNTYNHTRYTLAVLGLLLVPLNLLFTITADEQGERFMVRLWNTIRSVIILITVSLSLQLILLLNPTPEAVDLEGSCVRRSCQTTRGVRAASRRGRSGRWPR